MKKAEKIILGTVGAGLGLLLLSKGKAIAKSAGDRTTASISFEGRGAPASVIIGFRILDKAGVRKAIALRYESLNFSQEWQQFGPYNVEMEWPSLPSGSYDGEIFVDDVSRIYSNAFKS